MGAGEATAYTKPVNFRKENAKNRDGVGLDKRMLLPGFKKLCHNSVLE